MPTAATSVFMPSDNAVPEMVVGYISLRAEKSLYGPDGALLTTVGTAPFRASAARADEVRRELERLNIDILGESELGFSVLARKDALETLTKARLRSLELTLPAGRPSVRKRSITRLDFEGAGQPTAVGMGHVESAALPIDAIVLESPRHLFGTPPPPATVSPAWPEHHLRLPDDVARWLNAPRTPGKSGEGVLVAMLDSGWWPHPYYTRHGYTVLPPKTAIALTEADEDPVGHGTGIAANLFAVAPRAELLPIRLASNQNTVLGVTAGLHMALKAGARIVTNSWGRVCPLPAAALPEAQDMQLSALLMRMREQGVLVVFAAGNGDLAPEPQMPGVLSVGGVHVDAFGVMQASAFASGYRGPWFDQRVVPALCGLVGLPPRAQYLALPVRPASLYDLDYSATMPGEGNDSHLHDGWAVFSGTSSAAPQVAGAAAVLLGMRPDLRPDQVEAALIAGARDITVGRSHPALDDAPAGLAGDSATGAGLLDVAGAIAHLGLSAD